MPLTIAFLADPNSVHTRRWVAFFSERGHDVHLLVGKDDEVRPGLADVIAVHRYPRFGRRRLPLVSSIQGRGPLRRLLHTINPDVLHAHYLTRYGWQARLSGFHPYVVSPWGSDLFVTPRESARARIWARLTLRGADLVTVVSPQMRDAVRSHGVPDDRIETIQFGVDTHRFRPLPTAEAPPQLGLRRARLVFSPRAIRPVYRQDVVVDAFARLPDDCVLVMTARNADAGSLARVRERIAGHGLGDRVQVVGELGDDDMLALFQAAAAVVSVPESDAIPISVLEAMACGQPVVASDLPGPRHLLAPHDPDLLVPVGDAPATAAALRRVLELPDARRRSLAASMRAAVVGSADREANMKRMEALYVALRDRRS